MALLAFWDAVSNRKVTSLEIRRASTESGTFEPLKTIKAKDNYRNWITFFKDDNPLLSGSSEVGWYKVRYLDKSGATLEESDPKEGVAALSVTPREVLHVMQGLKLNYVSAEVVHDRILEALGEVEQRTGMSLSLKTATKEVRPPKDFEYILGHRRGGLIQLDNYPLYWDDTDATGNGGVEVFYRLRGVSNSNSDTAWTEIDIEPGYSPRADGFNPGAITIFPVSLNIGVPQTALFHHGHNRNALQVRISYQHGFKVWPVELKRAVTFHAAANAMEIAGEADTAGLSSRGIDGYSEAFTASATTTIFSARRLFYMQEFDKIIKRWSIVRPAY